MPDPFETLGVPRKFGIDADALAQRHRDLSRALHPDRHGAAPPAERRAAIERAVTVNEAYRALRDPVTRAEALLAARGRPLDEHARATQDVLVEMMELRESLEESRGDAARASALRGAVAARMKSNEATLATLLDADPPARGSLDEARDVVVRLKYLRRFVEEADGLLD